MSISKQFQHFHQEDLARKVDEIIDDINSKRIYNLGDNVQDNDSLDDLGMINAGVYTGTTNGDQFLILLDEYRSGIAFSVEDIFIFKNAETIIDCFSTFLGTSILDTPVKFVNCNNVNNNLGGNPSCGVENSTLHIKGTFTPTATIAAGTKLFSLGLNLPVKVTHGSAINSGTAGSETFVGISIQTNGDVYCLGALTSGVAYSIAVTATL